MQGGRPKDENKEKASANLCKFLDEEGESSAFTLDQVYNKGRKDVICFRSSLNKILREHLTNKSENPEDHAKNIIISCANILLYEIETATSVLNTLMEELNIVCQGWAIISHEGPDLEKLLKPRAAR